MANVSGDGAYDIKACHAAIAQRGAQAAMPPRKNGKQCKTTLVGASVRTDALKACHRLGYAICTKWSSHHRRNLVEIKKPCHYRVGERVMARTFERQLVEFHVRVELLNRFTPLGRLTMVPVALMG